MNYPYCMSTTTKEQSKKTTLGYRTFSRSYPMRGFGSLASASRFCRAFEEVRQFFRVRTMMKQQISLAHQREVFRHRIEVLKAMVLVA